MSVDETSFFVYSKSKSARAYGLISTHISDLPIFLLCLLSWFWIIRRLIKKNELETSRRW
jgi:hypothetical protein